MKRVMLFASLVGLVALVGIGVLLAADKSTGAYRPRGRARLQIGQVAGDFELPLLKAETNKKGEKFYRITDEKVKLSSFREKKVVCIFMSSYT